MKVRTKEAKPAAKRFTVTIAPDTTLGEIKGNHPGLYQVIKNGGVDGLPDDYAISVYEIDDSAEIYVVDDWM